MAFVVTLAAADADSTSVAADDGVGVGAVGGKGASLAELARAGVAVPPGFAVTVSAFAAAMTAIDPDGARRAEIEALPAEDLARIAAAAARFRAVVTGTPLPDDVAAAITDYYAALGAAGVGPWGDGSPAGDGPEVAVRSSATVEDSAEASFAGLQDTYLGVSGAGPVLEHVRRCWASLYNDESVAYRRRLGLPEAGVAMAVVVQRMVAPRAAGVMFTRSPVTGDRSVVAIEATWGLGSALVSGDVTPDAWVVSKVTGEITARRISSKDKIHGYIPNGGPGGADHAGDADHAGGAGEQGGVMGRVTVRDTPADLREAPCLTDEEIRALAAVARRVEAHYGAPQDIEWAVLGTPFVRADAGSAGLDPPGSRDPGTGSLGPGSLGPDAPAESRVVLLQSRPETVWAARDSKPAGSPKPRAADHVLTLFGKPL
ncbi:MAG: PEP/pyruvate-binding domain-containing protein [Trebonia sp.]